jgi:hypothetical protein
MGDRSPGGPNPRAQTYQGQDRSGSDQRVVDSAMAQRSADAASAISSASPGAGVHGSFSGSSA